MTTESDIVKAKQIAIDRELVAVNGIYIKQLLLDMINGYEQVVLDLENVSDCDTAGVQLLLSLRQTAQSMKRSVRLKSVPEVVYQSVAKYGVSLGDLFDVE